MLSRPKRVFKVSQNLKNPLLNVNYLLSVCMYVWYWYVYIHVHVYIYIYIYVVYIYYIYIYICICIYTFKYSFIQPVDNVPIIFPWGQETNQLWFSGVLRGCGVGEFSRNWSIIECRGFFGWRLWTMQTDRYVYCKFLWILLGILLWRLLDFMHCQPVNTFGL